MIRPPYSAIAAGPSPPFSFCFGLAGWLLPTSTCSFRCCRWCCCLLLCCAAAAAATAAAAAAVAAVCAGASFLLSCCCSAGGSWPYATRGSRPNYLEQRRFLVCEIGVLVPLQCFGWCVEQLLESGNNNKNNNSDIVARGLLPSLLGPIVIFLSLAF